MDKLGKLSTGHSDLSAALMGLEPSVKRLRQLRPLLLGARPAEEILHIPCVPEGREGTGPWGAAQDGKATTQRVHDRRSGPCQPLGG